MILVNDGSTDTSLSICESYQNKIKNLIILSQANSGPSVARNNGIHSSSGRYLAFLDADDTLTINAIPQLLKQANEDVDFLMWGVEFQWWDNNHLVKSKDLAFKEARYTTAEFIRKLNHLLNDYYFNFVWNKLYRRDFILENNIQFPTGVHRSEDLIFNINYLKFCKQVNIISDILYIHKNTNKSSITYTYYPDQFIIEKRIHKLFEETLKELDIYTDELREIIDNYFINMTYSMISYLINRDYGLSFKEKKKEICLIMKDSEVLKVYRRNQSNRLLVKIVYIFLKFKLFLLLFIFCRSIRFMQKVNKKV